VHTNQKRFQCERPREKRAVLRERKEALGSPVNNLAVLESEALLSTAGTLKTLYINPRNERINY